MNPSDILKALKGFGQSECSDPDLRVSDRPRSALVALSEFCLDDRTHV